MLTPEQIKAAQEAFNLIDEAGGTLDECWKAALNTVAAGYESILADIRKQYDEVCEELERKQERCGYHKRDGSDFCDLHPSMYHKKLVAAKDLWGAGKWLLDLKSHKDLWGADADYQREKPEAWASMKQAIAAFDAAMEE